LPCASATVVTPIYVPGEISDSDTFSTPVMAAFEVIFIVTLRPSLFFTIKRSPLMDSIMPRTRDETGASANADVKVSNEAATQNVSRRTDGIAILLRFGLQDTQQICRT